MAAHRTCQDLALLLLSAAVACHLLASSADGDSVVDASYKLNSGGLLIDDNYAYVLVMQWDCNLVLYEPRKNGGAPLWNSGTGGRGSGCYARMETDGVFAIYDSNQNRVWGTDSHQDDTNGCIYQAIMQTDGNFVIYCDAGEYSDKVTHAIWASNTSNQ